MGRGGNRYGAGRPGHRMAAEATRRIDMRVWRSGGLLKAGTAFSWHWTRGDERTGEIGVTITSDSALLNYAFGTGGGPLRDASQTVALTTTPCHYGGSRTWFRCPRCQQRALVLFLRFERFACRSCQRVRYQSQSGSADDRIAARFHRLEALVTGPKPKWQRWATREKLVERYCVVSEQFDAMLAKGLARLGAPGW
jgi:hypothetical protein